MGSKLRIPNNQGQMLIQAIIAIAIFGVLIVSFLNTVSSQRKEIKFNQSIVTRGLLEQRLEKYFSNSASMVQTRNASYLGNLKFSACYTQGSSACAATSQPVGIQLLDPSGTLVAGPAGSTPVRYSSRGEICASASEDCIFEVYAQYTATCASGSTCASPNSLYATYIIQQAAGITALGGFTFKTFTSAPIPVGAPPYTLTSYNRSYSAGTQSFDIGVHDFCGLSKFVYDGDGVGNCVLNGSKKTTWSLVISDEGDAQPQICGAICVDFL